MALFDKVMKSAMNAGKEAAKRAAKNPKIAGNLASAFGAAAGAGAASALMNGKRSHHDDDEEMEARAAKRAKASASPARPAAAPVPPPPSPAPVQAPQPNDGLDLSEFSPKMQILVRAAFEDGQVSESEMAVLCKQAQADGMDLDVFKMIFDAKFVRYQKIQQQKAMDMFQQAQNQKMAAMQQQQALQQQQTAPQPQPAPHAEAKSEKKKCPNCGSIIESGMAVCSSCGFALNAEGANSASERLANMLMELDSSTRNMLKSNSSDYSMDDLAREKANIIRNFPIPTDKANLLEFIISLSHRAKYKMLDKGYVKTVAKAYQDKREECMQKAHLFFENDPMFQKLFEEEAANAQPKKKKFGLF